MNLWTIETGLVKREKQIILIIAFFFIPFVQSLSINCQTDSIKYKLQIDSISNKEFYFLVDSMPEYPGGQSEMLKFFVTNFKYPVEIDACCKVIVEFIVDSTGQMTDLKIIRNLQKDFDNETLRVMKLMPKWKLGKLNGKPVNVKIIIPWNISLQ
jgi:hypothetical protein